MMRSRKPAKARPARKKATIVTTPAAGKNARRWSAEDRLVAIMKAVESTSDAIGISDAQGHHFYQNKALSDMFGYATAGELEAAGGGPAVVKDPAVAREMFANVMNGTSWAGELEMVTKIGRVFPAYIRADAIKDDAGTIVGLIGIITDITERRQAEEALRKSEEKFRALTESASDGIFLLSPDGVIVSLNAAFARMHGYTVEEMLSMDLKDLDMPETARLAPERMRRLLAGDSMSFEAEHYRKNRQPIPLEVSANLIVIDNQKYVLAFHRDITVRRQAQEALRALVSEREALLKEVHHRVKNNLQVINSLLRLESGRSAHPETTSVLTEMQSRIRAMALLHESLYRSGTFAQVDLGAYLRQLTAQLVRAQAPHPCAITLDMDITSVEVVMDQAIPCGLLVNELVANSLKHAFPDGRTGEIRVELRPVCGGPQVRLCVSDTGVGLPENFEARRRNSLGLQLVSDLTRQLRGTLEIGPGPAAVFSVTFTAAEPRASAVSASEKR